MMNFLKINWSQISNQESVIQRTNIVRNYRKKMTFSFLKELSHSPVCLSSRPSVCLSTHPSVHLPIRPYVYPSVLRLFVHSSIRLPDCLSAPLSIWISIHPSVHPSVYLFVPRRRKMAILFDFLTASNIHK